MTQPEGMAIATFAQNWSGSVYAKGNLYVVATAPTPIPMGTLTSPGWCVFNNLDIVNYCSIQNGSGGTEFLRLMQSDWAWCRLGPSVVPYAIANTAPISLQYWIIAP